MKKPNIILIGGGGHCKACIDIIEMESSYNINGIIDVPGKIGETILGYRIIDQESNIEKYIRGNFFLISVGFIKSPKPRIKLFNQLKEMGGKFPVVISPKAHVSKFATIKQGTIIMHGSVINADSQIGVNSIINNLALVEHDVCIGDHTHISTGARINGGCNIGDACFIGSGTVVNQSVNICSNVIVGSGSLVRKDINEPGVYAGNPLRKYK